MFDRLLYERFDAPFPRENTESEKWDDRAFFGNANALPMWVADMDFPTVPEVIEGLTARTTHGAFGYSIAGDLDAQALINWYKKRHALTVQKEDILFCPGVVDGIYHTLCALFEKGSRVVIQPPVYGPFFSMVEKAGMQVVENPLIREDDGWKMDFAGLEEILKQGAEAILLCSPHNPVGRVWTREELGQLSALSEKYGARILSDEIHADFELGGGRHNCILSVPGAENAVQLVSATKTFNLAALRHSAILCRDAAAREKIKARLSYAMADVNLYGRLATRLAYEHGENWLDTLLSYITENRDLMENALKKTGALKPVHVEGTYLMWVDCRDLGLKNKELMDFFIKKAAVLPSEGTFFGKQGDGFIRLNLATRHANIREAIGRINQALSQ